MIQTCYHVVMRIVTYGRDACQKPIEPLSSHTVSNIIHSMTSHPFSSHHIIISHHVIPHDITFHHITSYYISSHQPPLNHISHYINHLQWVAFARCASCILPALSSSSQQHERPCTWRNTSQAECESRWLGKETIYGAVRTTVLKTVNKCINS